MRCYYCLSENCKYIRCGATQQKARRKCIPFIEMQPCLDKWGEKNVRKHDSLTKSHREFCHFSLGQKTAGVCFIPGILIIIPPSPPSLSDAPTPACRLSPASGQNMPSRSWKTKLGFNLGKMFCSVPQTHLVVK